MEIELEEVDCEKAKVGDWIKFDNGGVALVLESNELVLLTHGNGSDWMELSEDCFKDEFKKRNYKILAKSEDVIIRGR